MWHRAGLVSRAHPAGLPGTVRSHVPEISRDAGLEASTPTHKVTPSEEAKELVRRFISEDSSFGELFVTANVATFKL